VLSLTGMASPAERVNWIVRISSELQSHDWTDERMVLNQFGIPAHSGSGTRDEVRSARLQAATDERLESLWRFVAGEQASVLAASSDSDLVRIWGQGVPRVFLSHRADYKLSAKQLKDELAHWQAATFVAHDDIEPTRVWQQEIERALRTMDVLVAVLSKGFAASTWTNQEVGVALGRGYPFSQSGLTKTLLHSLARPKPFPASVALLTKSRNHSLRPCQATRLSCDRFLLGSCSSGSRCRASVMVYTSWVSSTRALRFQPSC
jgi:hypothetical protein